METSMLVENVTVSTHDSLSGDSWLLSLKAPEIASSAQPGQFVHVRVPNLDNSVLRRPFSVFKADAGNLSILYKCVGAGTRAMALLRPGDEVSLLGPLGNGFPPVRSDIFPVLVAE
ncbi:FAD-binding oxidoreductase [Verrucomicrobiota bacterium]